MSSSKFIAITAAGLLGFALAQTDAAAHGGGGFHGGFHSGGMSAAYGRSFFGHARMNTFNRRGFNSGHGGRSNRGDMHGAHMHHDGFAKFGGRGTHWQTAGSNQGHWQRSSSFGDSHGSSHLEGMWSR